MYFINAMFSNHSFASFNKRKDDKYNGSGLEGASNVYCIQLLDQLMMIHATAQWKLG